MNEIIGHAAAGDKARTRTTDATQVEVQADFDGPLVVSQPLAIGGIGSRSERPAIQAQPSLKYQGALPMRESARVDFGFVPPGETARALGVTKDTLRRWRALRRGPAYVVIEGKIQYPRARLTEYVAVHTQLYEAAS